MRHLDEKKLLAYLGRRREFADPATHREGTLHIVKCSKCSKRIEEVRKKKRITLARQRRLVQPIELISPDDHTSAPDSAHLSERQLASYLNSRDEFADSTIRGAYGDHVSRCNQCSERLVQSRHKLRASGQLRVYEPEVLTPAGLKPAGRLSPAPIRPIDDPLAQDVSRQSGSSARTSGEPSGNGSGSGASVVESPLEDGVADLAAAKREVEAALQEAEVAREEAKAAKRDAEVTKQEAEAVRRQSAAALARYEAEATKTEEAETALKEADAARREAEAARKEADAAKRETAGVKAAAKKVARATKERREAEAARRTEVETARREAEQARREAETAREEARRASSAVTTGQIDATEVRLAEAARKEAEAARREAEAARKEAAAAQQKTAEIKTVALKVAQASKKRRAAETAHRAEAEVAKREAEEARGEADAARREAEVAKREADELRQAADRGKAAADTGGADREVAEAARMAAEAARTLAEAARKEAEVARKEADVARQEAALVKREAAHQRDVDVDLAVESALSAAAAARGQSLPGGDGRAESEAAATRRSRRRVALAALIPIAAVAAWMVRSTLDGSRGTEPVAVASPSVQPVPAVPEPATALPSDPAIGDSAAVAAQIPATVREPVAQLADDLRPAARGDPPAQVAVPVPVQQPRPVQPRAAQPQPEPAQPTPAPPPPAPRTIAGVVQDTGNNAPLPGARVVISGTGAATTSGSDGSFRFADVPAGDVEVVASLAGYDDASVRTVVAPGSEARIDLRLQPTEAPAPPADPEPAPASTGPTVLPTREETDPQLVSGEWVRIDRAEAEELLGRGLVAVADLPIESVAKPGSSNRVAVRVVQLLDSGERLEIVITRPPFLSRSRGRGGAARVSAVRVAEAAPGTPARGTARVGGYLVTAKADLASGALHSLLNRIADVPR